MSSLPIAVFDSGIGGLTIEKEIRKQLPHEDILYVADHLYAPYGDQTEDMIINRVNTITAKLVTSGIKALVIACNTATAIAIDQLRAHYPKLVIVGVEPAIKPAVQQTKTNAIGVLTTPATAKNKRFINLVNRFKEDKEIIIQPCPDLVEIIEDGRINQNCGLELMANIITPLTDKYVDTLVLGCTHYPFAMSAIQKCAPSINIIETSTPVTKELINQLTKNNLLNSKVVTPINSYLTTQVKRAALPDLPTFTLIN